MPADPRDEPAAEFSSPACAMHEADDAYMGYARRAELAGLLRALLGVQRLRVADNPEAARRLAMLRRHLAALDAPGSGDAPAAAGDPLAALRAMLPRIRDARLHADLRELLRWDDGA
ncbi:MAG: hypothetical protein J0I21_20935 [Alphaproteobacteria bacterium]|nr:hypothetical protein [Alphaproteobacteria bacterium]